MQECSLWAHHARAKLLDAALGTETLVLDHSPLSSQFAHLGKPAFCSQPFWCHAGLERNASDQVPDSLGLMATGRNPVRACKSSVAWPGPGGDEESLKHLPKGHRDPRVNTCPPSSPVGRHTWTGKALRLKSRCSFSTFSHGFL